MTMIPFESLDLSCPACDSPNQFPSGYFRTRSCSQCGTEYRAGIDGMKEPVKPITVKVVEAPSLIKTDWPDLELDIDLGPDDEVEKEDPEHPRCSFCGRKTDASTVTRGQGKLQKIIKTEIIHIQERIEVVEKILHTSSKVLACPDCCLNIKPIMRKIKDHNGNVIGEQIMNQGVRFPETEG